ncbi:MAG: hypothetical protein HC923_00485 [Myxococcales bacterium]|nr:hypothetical protein [Myxococcales bacterium]
MNGEADFMTKAMTLFMDMNEMIGRDFDKGLATLDEVANTEHVRRSEEAQRLAAEALAREAAAAPDAVEDTEGLAEDQP